MLRALLFACLAVSGCVVLPDQPPLTPEQRVTEWQREDDVTELDAESCRASCDENYSARLSRCPEQPTAELQQRCRSVAGQIQARCYADCAKN